MADTLGEATAGGEAPVRLLFVCDRNSVRSPMAHGLAAAQYGTRLAVESVGLAAGTLDPFSVAAMAEIGIDIADHVPRDLASLGERAFDHVIALTPAADARARELFAGRPARLDYWPVADPTRGEGSREQRLAAYRAVRDDLAARIAALFPRPPAG